MILHRLREGYDVEFIMGHIATGDFLQQLHLEPGTGDGFVYPFQHEIPTSLQTATSPYLICTPYQTNLGSQQDVGPVIMQDSETYRFG